MVLQENHQSEFFPVWDLTKQVILFSLHSATVYGLNGSSVRIDSFDTVPSRD